MISPEFDMKSVALILFVCCSFCSSSASAIECQSTPGPPSTGWWSWRDIEGRKCWFIKAGAMPPKSDLHWPTKDKQEAASVEAASPVGRTGPEPLSPSQVEIENPARQATTLPQFNTARVKPITGAPLGLMNGHVDLMNGTPLSSMQTLGARRKPASADPFSARFTGTSN